MMFSGMRFTKTTGVHLSVPKSALGVIFDECDRYDADETGGRVLGTYTVNRGKLDIKITGIIEPGPAASRTATYFKQDGVYQEGVFRTVEGAHPEIEHLGNWHTHHVNGLRHLSSGDLETYHRTVNHENHNTDFFYALLVTEKKSRRGPLERYEVKHYLIRRGDAKAYEIPSSAVTITDDTLVWPHQHEAVAQAAPAPQRTAMPQSQDAANRLNDREALAEFFPGMKTFMSKELGVYWRGPLALIDASNIEVVVLEHASESGITFSPNIRRAPDSLATIATTLSESNFKSCREALITVERACNSALFKLAGGR